MPVRALLIAFLLFSFGLVSLAGVDAARADAVSKKFGGQVLTSNKKFPNKAKSASAYISKLKKQKKAKFWENKETQEYTVHIAAFFKRPLTDLEYTIRFVDDRGQLVGTPFEQFTTSAGDTSVLSTVILDRKTFGVNRRLQIQVMQNGRTVATGKFQILGEAEKFSGKVDFSEDDTK